LLERKVVRTGIAYVVLAWPLLEIGNTLLELLSLSPEATETSGHWLLIAIAVGFPVTLVLSWIFDFHVSGVTVTHSGSARLDDFRYADPQPIDVAGLNLNLTPRNALMGRVRELRTIASCIDRAVSGSGSMILIGGEPGVGKTRLGEEALVSGRNRGMLPLTGHAYEERGAAFITSTEILEEILRILPADALRNALGPTAPEMSKLLPELRRIFPEIPEPIELPPDQQQRYLFNRVLEFLERLSRCSPLIFLLDDLHWADESSVLLLEHVMPHLERLPVIFVITYRDVTADMDDPFQRVLPELLKQKYVTRIALPRLNFDEVRSLLAELGGTNPPDAIVELFMRETRGNAFFVHSVYRHLEEEGKLFDAGHQWLADIDEQVVPEDVRLVVRRRLDRLDDVVIDLLRTAAVMGLRFTLDVVERASEVSADAGLDAIEQAEAAGLVFPAQGRRQARYEFSHALVRQTLLESISSARRQRLHLKIAEAMQSLFGAKGPHLVSMARHFYRAGTAADADTTVRYLDLAGRQLLATSAADEALFIFDTALGMEHEMAPVQRAHLLYHKGLALRGLGRWLDAARAWEEALPILEASAEHEIVARVCWDLAYQCIWLSQNEVAIALALRGLGAIGDDATPARGRLLAILGHAYGTSGDWTHSEIYMPQALALAESLSQNRLLQAEVLISAEYRSQHWCQGARSADIADRTIAIMRQSGTPWDLSSALGVAMIAYMLNGRFDDAEALYAEGRALAERHGDIGNEMHHLMIHGTVQSYRGRLDTGRELLEAGVNWCRDNNLPWTSIFQTWLGMALFWRGDWDGAADLMQRAVAAEVPHGFTLGEERGHRLLLLAYRNDERCESAMAECESLLPVAGAENPQGRWFVGMAMVEAAALMGRLDTAAALYPQATQLIAAGSKVLWTLGLTEKHAAIAAAADGRWDLANEHFDKALQQATEIGYPMGRADTLCWRGRMLLASGAGDESRAEALLEEAGSLYAGLGMPQHVQMVRRVSHSPLLMS